MPWQGRPADSRVSLCCGQKLDVPSSPPKTTKHSARLSNSPSYFTNTTELMEPSSPPRITTLRQQQAVVRTAASTSAADEQNISHESKRCSSQLSISPSYFTNTTEPTEPSTTHQTTISRQQRANACEAASTSAPLACSEWSHPGIDYWRYYTSVTTSTVTVASHAEGVARQAFVARGGDGGGEDYGNKECSQTSYSLCLATKTGTLVDFLDTFEK